MDFPNVTHLTLAQETYAKDNEHITWFMTLLPSLTHFKISINISTEHIWFYAKTLKLESLSYIQPSNNHDNIQDLPFPNEMTVERRSIEHIQLRLAIEMRKLFQTITFDADANVAIIMN